VHTSEVTTAQAAYAAMLRDQIAPRLRELGCRGSGWSYLLPDDRWWALIGFQKDRHSDAAQVRFTVNVAAADKALWDAARVEYPWLPARPTANTHYPVGELIRIGRLLPTRVDTWWAVPAGAPTDAVADEVVRAVRDHALPWIRERLGPVAPSRS
jgi:Domain of unknown function (DUF4304)